MTIQQAMELAISRQRAGDLAGAESMYRQILAIRPELADAHANLGIVLRQSRRLVEAEAALRRAVELRPQFHEALMYLGSICQEQGELDEAAAAFERAVAVRPDSAEAFFNLGNTLSLRGNSGGAIAAYRRALLIRPGFAEAFNAIGATLSAGNDPNPAAMTEAISAFRAAVAARGDFAEAWFNLGHALSTNAASESPGVPEVSERNEAIGALSRAIALRPNWAHPRCALGINLCARHDWDAAEASLRQALALHPDLADAHYGLATALAALGRIGESVAAGEKAVAIDPGNFVADSNRVYALWFHPGYDAAAILREHRLWSRRHAEPLREFIPLHGNERSAARRLRIGYVSPDFRDHVVGRNVLPLIQRHNSGQFEVFCYSSAKSPDAVTARFKSAAGHWRDISAVSDADAAAMIRADRIDILVDLSLHMSWNRLLVFARKPAPVQITFAGYPGTTGLETMDWRLTDPYLDPPGKFDADYSERSWRLPHSFWCYDPAAMEAPESEIEPAKTRAICFGCLNNFTKVNDGVLGLWSRVLKAVPDSRLLLLAPAGSARAAVNAKFAECGVDPARIDFTPHLPRSEYFASMGRIDIGLDTFPYNGHTTSLDALWMGVPVVTLAGKTVAGRAGLSQLTNLNLTELAARTEDQFAQIASGLANDRARLAELRGGLRQRMRNSALTDGDGFARAVEAAYRGIWNMACNP